MQFTKDLLSGLKQRQLLKLHDEVEKELNKRAEAADLAAFKVRVAKFIRKPTKVHRELTSPISLSEMATYCDGTDAGRVLERILDSNARSNPILQEKVDKNGVRYIVWIRGQKQSQRPVCGPEHEETPGEAAPNGVIGANINHEHKHLSSS